ncbi:MAG: hypothetical protein VW397_08015 [Candidatus Margulisiibacteriota bacterium]
MKLKFFMLIFLSLLTYAHPVMWKGAQDYSIRYSESLSDMYAYYTLSRYTAIGFHINDSMANRTGIYAHVNRRLFRNNTNGAQQNVYGLLGLGAQDEAPAIHASIEWDWESQKYFLSVKGTGYTTGLTGIRARWGFAPYVADFSDLHTWLMIEYESNNSLKPYTTLTPLIRLFKGQYLIEVGIGSRSFLAVMVHF